MIEWTNIDSSAVASRASRMSTVTLRGSVLKGSVPLASSHVTNGYFASASEHFASTRVTGALGIAVWVGTVAHCGR
jgi:hypothetical protein